MTRHSGHGTEAVCDKEACTYRLRVMTYNIHHGRGTDGKYDLDRIASVIAAEQPDIVALQEIERHRRRTDGQNQPEVLAEKLGMNHCFAKVVAGCHVSRHEHAGYGNAILTRFPVQAHEHFNISYNSALCEPRGCLHATVNVEGAPLHVFCVHLGLRYRERHYQIERLLSEDIVNNPKFGIGPKILLGDFNNWWPVKSARLVDRHFHNAIVVTGRKRLRTFGKFFNYLCLDYVFTSPELSVMSCHAVRKKAAMVASDHRPVLCTVEMTIPHSSRQIFREELKLANSA
jgi:endonuclease/exonuclease/phosphatase family metal-dependent hydrolase